MNSWMFPLSNSLKASEGDETPADGQNRSGSCVTGVCQMWSGVNAVGTCCCERWPRRRAWLSGIFLVRPICVWDEEGIGAKKEDIMILHSQLDPANCYRLTKDDLSAPGLIYILHASHFIPSFSFSTTFIQRNIVQKRALMEFNWSSIYWQQPAEAVQYEGVVFPCPAL